MEETLKITNALSDPTRFNIYQFIIEKHKPVTVLNVADEFDIHPNVARLHLSKLEDINIISSSFERTGRGGRPSKLYQLSDEVIELNFPHRDYKLFASIAMESFTSLGEPGQFALYKTGEKYGEEIITRYKQRENIHEPSIDEKIKVLEQAGTMLGMYPSFEYDEKNEKIYFEINNCPFKEIAVDNQSVVCTMHRSFIKGMFKSLFPEVVLTETENVFKGCSVCSYTAELVNI